MKLSAPVADFEALAVTVAVARAQQQETDELEGRRRSRAAFRRWKERLPVALSEDGDVDILVARHRDYWLRSAACFVQSIDPSGFGATGFHVLDFADFGLDSDTLAGFALPEGAFDIFRELLPRSARPGPVVAVNVRTQARHHARRILETASESSLRETIRVGITGTVLHEAAHVVDFAIRGAEIPDGLTVADFREAYSSPASVQARRLNHGETWVRAFGHLTFRSSVRPPADYWSQLFAFDVEEHYDGPGEEILDALVPELVSTSSSASLVDAIRLPSMSSLGRLLVDRRNPQE